MHRLTIEFTIFQDNLSTHRLRVPADAEGRILWATEPAAPKLAAGIAFVGIDCT